MTEARTRLVRSFGFLAWSELRRGHTVCVHAEDCAMAAGSEDADECTCHPYRIKPHDPRPMAVILSAIERAHAWH